MRDRSPRTLLKHFITLFVSEVARENISILLITLLRSIMIWIMRKEEVILFLIIRTTSRICSTKSAKIGMKATIEKLLMSLTPSMIARIRAGKSSPLEIVLESRIRNPVVPWVMTPSLPSFLLMMILMRMVITTILRRKVREEVILLL